MPLKKGMVSEVASGSWLACTIAAVAATAAKASITILMRPRKTFRRLLGDFQVVVVEADGAVDQCEQQHDPDEHILQIAPQQDSDGDAGQDHEPAHGRRALLLDDMPLRAVFADGLAPPWRMRKERITFGPNRNTNSRAVISAPPVRNVM